MAVLLPSTPVPPPNSVVQSVTQVAGDLHVVADPETTAACQPQWPYWMVRSQLLGWIYPDAVTVRFGTPRYVFVDCPAGSAPIREVKYTASPSCPIFNGLGGTLESFQVNVPYP